MLVLHEVKPGGSLVVLLHGWGDSAEGIASLAPSISPANATVVVPQGFVPHSFGGWGWWDLDAQERPVWAWPDGAQASGKGMGHAGVLAARSVMLNLIAGLRAKYEPESVALVGFSQGAMLALDVGLQPESAVDSVAALSGALLAGSLGDTVRARFLVVHGEQDDVVPVAGGEAARDLLRGQGYDVSWYQFSGGHEVPEDAAAVVHKFLEVGSPGVDSLQ